MLELIKADFKAILLGDPAVRSRAEALICYAGFHALVIYRISNLLWKMRFCLVARLISQIGRFLTGVEIHPGAMIGRSVFIDHGMGVVIGETAIVGDNVTIFHGVTLGGSGKHRGKRHPTVGSKVIIGAHAQIIGPVVIGESVKVGAGAVVVTDIPPHSTVVGVPPAQRIILRDRSG